MSGDAKRRWYQVTLIEWIVIATILAILVILLLPAIAPRGHGHPETRTTYNRAAIWLGATIEFEKLKGRSVASVDELKGFVYSEACEFCNAPDVKFDWWGTPFRIWIDEDRHGRRRLNVQSAHWNKTFEEDDKTWKINLSESRESNVPAQSAPKQEEPQP